MKNKNSWEMSPTESLFTKQERKDRYQDYRQKHPNEDENSFLCVCGHRHKWSEIGRRHN